MAAALTGTQDVPGSAADHDGRHEDGEDDAADHVRPWSQLYQVLPRLPAPRRRALAVVD
jgi:hypothetical protein